MTTFRRRSARGSRGSDLDVVPHVLGQRLDVHRPLTPWRIETRSSRDRCSNHPRTGISSPLPVLPFCLRNGIPGGEMLAEPPAHRLRYDVLIDAAEGVEVAAHDVHQPLIDGRPEQPFIMMSPCERARNSADCPVSSAERPFIIEESLRDRQDAVVLDLLRRQDLPQELFLDVISRTTLSRTAIRPPQMATVNPLSLTVSFPSIIKISYKSF